MTTSTIQRSISEQIATLLRLEILTGGLQPGDALREQELSERFGVSRGPIRDAFRQLTHNGLLVQEPNKGARVASCPSPNVRPLLAALRRMIESYALSGVFDDITAEDIALWEGILSDIRSACERGDASDLVSHDLRFHKSIIECHGDEDGLMILWWPIMLRMVMQYSRHECLMDSYREHERILEAIRAGNRAEAHRALDANIQ